jgi:hypothetical protein
MFSANILGKRGLARTWNQSFRCYQKEICIEKFMTLQNSKQKIVTAKAHIQGLDRESDDADYWKKLNGLIEGWQPGPGDNRLWLTAWSSTSVWDGMTIRIAWRILRIFGGVHLCKHMSAKWKEEALFLLSVDNMFEHMHWQKVVGDQITMY